MNVNVSNEFNFSYVHGAMNQSGSLSKLKGVYSSCTQPTVTPTKRSICTPSE